VGDKTWNRPCQGPERKAGQGDRNGRKGDPLKGPEGRGQWTQKEVWHIVLWVEFMNSTSRTQKPEKAGL
jgi:hypothetical protein